MRTLTLGKALLSLVAAVTSIGPYMADWSETHVLNPNWPPHARFHNGQTMTTGLLIGALALYYLHSPLPAAPYSSSPSKSASTSISAALQTSRLNFVLALLHLYYLPALSGILYPGAAWMDPEFGEGRPQLFGFPVFLMVSWVGWWMERERISRAIEQKTG
ncbi:hypothetical protein BS50DRAFT_637600 [Corynespora cassiicola Philippines]|uniref:Uncharacterized protein n=1 Tax=Corynespora cassiicola Philippines TaxID=1448308 RepID=A0A2T2NC70_CORCC|nr:hypothetical protein BS50DRAFT_637600 [Corynespora cassiicola Philippines]